MKKAESKPAQGTGGEGAAELGRTQSEGKKKQNKRDKGPVSGPDTNKEK